MSTIGTSLQHARDLRLSVEVLVEGHWLRGEVALVDGFGVVLDRGVDGQSVVRIESISAVTIGAEAPAAVQPMVTQRVLAEVG